MPLVEGFSFHTDSSQEALEERMRLIDKLLRVPTIRSHEGNPTVKKDKKTVNNEKSP